MPLEMYIFNRGNEEAIGYEVVMPGEKRHIPNVPLKGPEEIYEVFCRSDDQLSTVHIIYPMAITGDSQHLKAIYNRKDSKNLPIIIRKDEEINLSIRQRVVARGRKKFVNGYVCLTQR